MRREGKLGDGLAEEIGWKRGEVEGKGGVRCGYISSRVRM